MDSKRKIALLFVLATAPMLALAQEGGGGHGEAGGSGCGDVFGDLIHIKRDATTGQPILQKRWVELPGDTYGWAFCPIAIDGSGAELPFAELSCDPVGSVVEVNYFGRLSGGRTKERNSRMHFDEVISSIKDPAVGSVSADETGRMLLGYDCATDAYGVRTCASWRTIDSPMENLALYARLMKYGHFQTDPLEVDTFAHGDPALGTQYHPALTAADYAKFEEGMKHLLPKGGDPTSCFVEGAFNGDCGANKSLDSKDFIRAASLLAAAADKTGIITVDLVQYMNRILKITLDTPLSTKAVDTLPARVRDCGGGADVAYLPLEQCTLRDGTSQDPAPANERFVKFSTVIYSRPAWRDSLLTGIRPVGIGSWSEFYDVRLMDYLNDVNGRQPGAVTNIEGFVSAASDGLRAVEFVHNYAIPDDLWDFVPNHP